MNKVLTYEAPKGAVLRDDYTVNVRVPGGNWQPLSIYEVKVDMHEVRPTSMAYFDMEGIVEVRVECKSNLIQQVVIRPLSAKIVSEQDERTLTFKLDRPRKLSIEINEERFANLHLFANPMEQDVPDPDSDRVLYFRPAIHRTEDIYRLLQIPKKAGGDCPDTIYFAAGMHWLEETILRIPSGITVYVAGGAVVAGSFVCEKVSDVTIRGRGVLYLADFHRFSAFRGVKIIFSERITVEGITTVDPPHYSIYLGKSSHVTIRNFKTFSTRGWSDGIDIMACSYIQIDDVFLRTSDDCIAIYGTRWDYVGDSRFVTVRNSVFWADVAHPLMIGTHGNHSKEGDIIEDIVFENIDILEHHEPQLNYMGAMTINAGDKNTVRRVTYRDIRVEDFELGRLLDIRVIWNKDYNPVPGKRIEDIRFEGIAYEGSTDLPSQIFGFDEERIVSGITISGFRINGKEMKNLVDGNIEVNNHVSGIVFE